MCYMLWDSGFTHFINPYFELYTHYKPLEKGDDTEVNGIGGIVNPKGVVIVILDLEYNTGQIHNLIFEQVYYLPRAPNLLTSPQKWARYRVEDDLRRRVTYIKMMVKYSVLVCNDKKSQRTILHDPG